MYCISITQSFSDSRFIYNFFFFTVRINLITGKMETQWDDFVAEQK